MRERDPHKKPADIKETGTYMEKKRRRISERIEVSCVFV